MVELDRPCKSGLESSTRFVRGGWEIEEMEEIRGSLDRFRDFLGCKRVVYISTVPTITEKDMTY